LKGKIVAMSEPNDLRAALVGIIEYAHGLHRQIDELSSTVIALQMTVRGLDPTFGEVREAKAVEIAAALEPYIAHREKQFAELLERIQRLRLP
jgi:hypothetical protein